MIFQWFHARITDLFTVFANINNTCCLRTRIHRTGFVSDLVVIWPFNIIYMKHGNLNIVFRGFHIIPVWLKTT